MNKIKKIAAALGTLALAGGLIIGTAAPASAYGSGSWSAGTCSPINADNTYAGSSYSNSAGQIVYVSMAAPTICIFAWQPTGYVQTRKNPNGLTGATNCTGSSCGYVLQTTYGSKNLYWGGVHYFNNKINAT